MADTKAMITQAAIIAPRAVVKVITEATDLAESIFRRNAAGNAGKAGEPQLKQPSFNSSAKKNMVDLETLKCKVKKHLHDKNYDTADTEKCQ